MPGWRKWLRRQRPTDRGHLSTTLPPAPPGSADEMTVSVMRGPFSEGQTELRATLKRDGERVPEVDRLPFRADDTIHIRWTAQHEFPYGRQSKTTVLQLMAGQSTVDGRGRDGLVVSLYKDGEPVFGMQNWTMFPADSMGIDHVMHFGLNDEWVDVETRFVLSLEEG